MLKNILTNLIFAVGSALVILALLIACVECFGFNNNFYKQEYQKLNTAQVVGVSGDMLNQATDKLLNYLKDTEKDLNLPYKDGINEDGQYYNQREKAHMVDVKVLYQNAKTFMAVGFVLGGLLIASGFIIMQKQGLKKFVTCYFNTGLVILAFFVLIALYAVLDFSSFWTNFHLVFFTNDLWMLDPATSLLIRMYEQTFFFDLVGSILIMFFGIFGGSMIACKIAKRKLI